MNKRIQFVFAFATMMLFSVNALFSQGTACHGTVNISIDATCTAQISPATMQPGIATGTSVAIKVSDLGLTSASSALGPVLTGGTLTAGVYTGATISINTANLPAFFATGMRGFPVSVNDGANSCWGMVMLEDKLPPKIQALPDVTVSCLATADAKGNPTPIAVFGAYTLAQRMSTDGFPILPSGIPQTSIACSQTSTPVYLDEVTNFTCSPSELRAKLIRRIWAVTNVKGMVRRDTQSITVLNVSGATLTCPKALVEVSCADGITPAQLAARLLSTDDDSIAYPYVVIGTSRSYLLPNVSVCNVIATFTDTPINACAGCTAGNGTLKVARSWLILDWCTGGTRTCSQIIKAKDDIAPVIAPIPPLGTFTVDAWGCEARIVLPRATVTDVCDRNAGIVAVDGPLGVVIIRSGLDFIVTNAPKGIHTFTYTARDCCGNTSTSSISVTVLDKVAPVASAKEFIVISLTSSGDAGTPGVAKLYTQHVNNNSYDNCTAVYMEIRREDNAPACLNEGLRIRNRVAPFASVDSFWNNNRTYNG